jgi:hypothetical protein
MTLEGFPMESDFPTQQANLEHHASSQQQFDMLQSLEARDTIPDVPILLKVLIYLHLCIMLHDF